MPSASRSHGSWCCRHRQQTPAAPDTGITFSVEVIHDDAGAWAGTVTIGADGPETVIAATATGGRRERASVLDASRCRRRGRRLAGGVRVITADLNYDYRTDLVLVGAGGLAFKDLVNDGDCCRSHRRHEAGRRDAAHADARGLAGRCRSRWRSRSRRSRRSTATPSCCATTATAPSRDSSRSAPAAASMGSRGRISTAKACPMPRASTRAAPCSSSSISAAAPSRPPASLQRPRPCWR